MSFSLLSVVIIGVTAAMIYKKMRKGYKHGLSRSLMDLATLLCCAVFSALVSALLSKLVTKLLTEAVFSALENAGAFASLKGAYSLLTGALELVLAMIISVLLYLPVFFLLKAVLRRLVKIVSAIVLRKSRRGLKKKEPQYLSEEAPFYVRNDKKIAAGVGAFTGLILAIVIFMPLTGLLKTADDIVDTVADMTQSPKIEQSAGVRLLDHYANDAGVTVLHASGGRVLYDMTARASYEGHSTHINKEIEIIRSMRIADIVKEIKATGKLGGGNTQMIQDVVDELDDSLCLKLVMVDFIQGASQSWMQYEPYLGISRPSLGNYRAIDDFFDTMLFVCSTTTIDTYDDDMKTILGIVGILEDYQAIFTGDGYETFMKEFVEGDALKRIESELHKNPRMSAVNAAIDGLVMNLIATELSGLEYALEGQPEIYQGIADILNNARGLEGSVKTTAIANGLSESFAEHGVYLPPAMEDRVASILVSNVPTDETLTQESVKQYFDEYMQSAGNG